MVNCCACDGNLKKGGYNIFKHSTGNPPASIGQLLFECVRQTDKKIKSDGICNRCLTTVNRYYRAKQIVDQVRLEVLELFASSPEDIEVKGDEVVEDVILLDPDANGGIVAKEEEPETIIMVNEDGKNFESLEEFIEENSEENLEDVSEALPSCKAELDEAGDETVDYEIDPCFMQNSQTVTDIMDVHDDSIDEEFLLNEMKDDEEVTEISIGTSKTKLFQCSKCDEIFLERKAYQSHYKQAHFAGYICEECGKTLYSHSGFINHKKSHDPVKKYQCPECDASYHLKIQLKYHMAWHTGEKPYQCEICSKQFVHRVSLYKHKKLHESNERRFECTVCGSKFRTSAHLRRHSMTHTGAKPHSCPICGKCFAQAYNMRVHVKEHKMPRDSKRRRYDCSHCENAFRNKKSYHLHLEFCGKNRPQIIENLST